MVSYLSGRAEGLDLSVVGGYVECQSASVTGIRGEGFGNVCEKDSGEAGRFPDRDGGLEFVGEGGWRGGSCGGSRGERGGDGASLRARGELGRDGERASGYFELLE